jgi:hypothetical protein
MRNRLIVLFTVAAMAGCGNGEITDHGTSAGRADGTDFNMGSHGMIERDAVRIRKDAQRNRLWVLTFDEVRVYDTVRQRKRLIRKIELPNWSAARFICAPDMVLDKSGSAILSSNVQPSLWLIDADSFALEERKIRLREREQWDSGFRALAFAADGTLMAAASMDRSLWKIDIPNASAIMIEINPKRPLDECAFAPHSLIGLERRQQP